MSEGQFGPTYHLYGVISHAGSGPNSGHYYAHVKGGNGSWYEMNDDYVEKVKSAPTGLKNAYILFYIQEKGQSLEAALNSTTSSATSSRTANGNVNGNKTATNGNVHQSMKKRRVVTSDDEDEDAGEKVQPIPTRLIGPQLPSNTQKATSSSNTQTQTPPSSPTTAKPYAHAEYLKKKIDAAEKGKKLTKPPPSKLPLVDYGDDDDEMDAEIGTKVERQSLSASATQSSFVESFKDSPPPQPPVSSFPSSPMSSTSTSIAPTNFYSNSTSKKSTSETAKKRKSPDGDVEMRTSSEASTRPPLADLRQKSSGGSSSKSASSDLIRSAGNPYSRITGSNNLNSSREDILFKPRKLMKKQYGQKKRLLI